MIEILHKKGLDLVQNSDQKTDNGTDKTLRQVTIKDTFYRGDFEPSQDYKSEEYLYNNGLIIEDTDDHRTKNKNFVIQEWADWKQGLVRGYSRSQNCYPELWKGKFDEYCYSDRLGPRYLQRHLDRLSEHPESRQHFLSIWTKQDEINESQGKAVPCTIGYHSQIIDDTLYVSFIYRSIEMTRNFVNDLYLNRKYIQDILFRKENLMVSKVEVCYFINNAHFYTKEFDRCTY